MFKISLKEAKKFWESNDDFMSDEHTPAIKRLKALQKSKFPHIMASDDPWEREERSNSKVRYVPIQVEAGHPSTSTPNDVLGKYSKARSIPIRLVDIEENGPATPIRKTKLNSTGRPVIHSVIEDDDEDEVTLVETKTRPSKKPTKIYVDLDDDDEDQYQQDDDVIFIKKVTTPPPVKPYKYFVTNTDTVDKDNESVQYYKVANRFNARQGTSTSPRSYNKFVAPAGITKAYRKLPTPVPKWMQSQKPTSLSHVKSTFLNLNGNTRSTLAEVFNLDEKRNYQELIKRVTGRSKPTFMKPSDIINVAEDSASFRHTQRTQKNALNEISFLEKGLLAEKENVESDKSKEYDPITVASINSSDSEVEVVPSECSTSSSTRIDPVNSLRDSYKDMAVTNKNFLSKVDLKYRLKKLEIQEKLKDARRESDIISKVNSEQKLAHLQNKLKHELSIPESLIEEPEPTVELPQLTPEQEKLVNRALGPGPPNQVLVEKFNLKIHRRDLQTLAGLNWLNDEVINFYMNLIMQRSEERKDLPKVYAANTFFYPKLMQSGQPGLRRWTRKVDIFAHDLMVVPVHLGVHWCVSLLDFREKRVRYLDSMGGGNPACLAALLQYLRDEHNDKKGQPFDDGGWKTECISKKIPQQMNGSDCGMFSCTFAEFAARRAPFSFTQAHMPALRRKAALEILQGKLML